MRNQKWIDPIPGIHTSTVYAFTKSVDRHASIIKPGTIADATHRLSVKNAEPLLVAMDCLLKYAQAYKVRFDGPLANDGVLGDYWLDSIKNLRKLLCGDGAIALERGITTDSKDNGVIEGMFWDALEAAGFTEETANL